MKFPTKGPWAYLAVFISSAFVMTVYEAIKEAFFEGKLTPWQSHSMTIIVVALLATFIAIIIREWSDEIIKKEEIVNLREQKLITLALILRAVQHIVNNFLNHFLLIKRDIEKTGTVDDATIEKLEKGIKEVGQQLKALEALQEPEKEDSYKDIYPK